MWVRTWAQRRTRRLAERYQWVVVDSATTAGQRLGDGQGRAPPTQGTPPPPPREKLFHQGPLPHTPRIFLFLALNPLVLLLIRFWGGKSQDASRQETRNCDAGHIGEDQTGDRV